MVEPMSMEHTGKLASGCLMLATFLTLRIVRNNISGTVRYVVCPVVLKPAVHGEHLKLEPGWNSPILMETEKWIVVAPAMKMVVAPPTSTTQNRLTK